MRTRSRSRVINIIESPEVEVVDAMETAENLPSHFMEFLADNIDIDGLELDDLFGIEDFKWTLAKDTAGHHGQLLDMALADFGVNGAKDQDSGIEASTASSPERSSNLRVKNTQSQSSRVINKNAIAARLNRLKKKAYVNSLEKKVGILSTENNVLKQKSDQLTKRVEELEDETRALTQTTITMPYPGSMLKWRRKRHLVVCVCMWTRTSSQWSSVLSVQSVQAHRSKPRLKYSSLFPVSSR
ncbi:CREB/ATF bZIP transcription factor [Lates japonicus]|uniref:CREB/ATF bZIP transcription factor n=1 Tax=Lates japonicus TaxID=270547 RepID=A0AAD3QUW2_LATJO|nr:CREB/ATF bZIP transcription factor [Lates japonicus]